MSSPEIMKASLASKQQPNSKKTFGENKSDECICGSSSDPAEMVMGSFYISKYDPSKPQGQDAHFLLPEFQTFGLADGVGGLKKQGIDSGEYSRELMSNVVLSVQNRRRRRRRRNEDDANDDDQELEDGPVDPKAVLNEAFLKTGAQGASTACVVTLDGNNLHAVNIGDSGFVHVRGGKIIYRSRVQQHKFNHPYQLRKGRRNVIRLAEEMRREVEEGDVIVAGTDGLFDNVHKEELEKLVRDGREESGDSPEDLAGRIARFAYRQSQERNIVSPYAVQSCLAGRAGRLGGKHDDITVVVAYIHSIQFN